MIEVASSAVMTAENRSDDLLAVSNNQAESGIPFEIRSQMFERIRIRSGRRLRSPTTEQELLRGHFLPSARLERHWASTIWESCDSKLSASDRRLS